MGFQENGVLKARLDLLDLLDRLDSPELNQFNLPMDPSLLRAHRARQVHPVHEDQPGFQELKGHWGLQDYKGGTELQVFQADPVSEARLGFLDLRDLKDYEGLGEAEEQLTSDGETRRVPPSQEPNLFTLAELLVVIGAAPGELAIFFVYPRNPSTRKNSSQEHNATLRCMGSSTRRSTARL